ncbi:MAG: acetate--CoA ligase family protein [Candidatus Magnetomorum sp.]|nr:acetate--CoA ligase family protein [Candidatus Magnetomorum sp.]
MNTYHSLLAQVKADHRKTLDELESKTILKAFNIPVVQEKRTASLESAIDAAKQFGYPVYIKAIGKKLLHKTEHDLVYGNIMNDNQVRQAVLTIQQAGRSDVDGFLVQSQVQGKRELTAGLFHDPQFGPVVMFGIGGIFAEALKDVVFRLVPLDKADAEEMIDSIHAKSLLQSFRGEQAVNREQLIQILLGLSQMVQEIPEIREVDINPFVVSKEGQLTAVDALIILDDCSHAATTYSSPIQPVDLGPLFYPKSIVFVGASHRIGKWGHMLLTNTQSGGYKGDIYLVNAKGGEISGVPVYPSVETLPGPVELAVVTIPAQHVIDLIPQLKEKQVKGMLVITSGFREIGPAGLALEQALVEEAHKAGIIILGPNTMGICNPHFQFYCSGAHVHPKPGSTVLVAQSGNMGTQLLAFAEQQGIGIRAFSGSGNEAMTTIEDYMEAFEQDHQTQSVVLYIESVKNGRRFFESARRMSPKKPIVILKGGRTQEGGQAAQSHTGAMASDARIFNAACHQAGVILVKKPMDLLDVSAVFSALPLPKGNRVAIMTLGGGWGVVTSDLCSEYGLQLPVLSNDIIEQFDRMLPPFWSRANPVDLVGEGKPDLPFIGLETLLKWDGCDAVIHLGIHGRRLFVERMLHSIHQADSSYSKDFLDEIKTKNQHYEKKYIAHIIQLIEKYQKPVLGVSLLTDKEDQTLYSISESDYKCVLFPSPERAVFALSRMCQYQAWMNCH